MFATTRWLRRSWLCLVLGTGLLLNPTIGLSVDPVGWRTDGTGHYAKTEPPLEWSPEKNVLWKTPLPGASNSSPVLLDHRIFVCAEPCTLFCLHREDGRVLWKKNSAYDELEIEAGDRERLKIELAETEQIARKQANVTRESEMLRRKLKDNPAAKDEIEKQLADLRKQNEDLQGERQKRTLAVRYTEPRKQSDAGFSTPTPVTNGSEVFVAFGNGLVACFDLEGNRKWLRLIEHSTAPYAHGASPVLVGDKLVVHFADMVAIRAKDGTECWRVKQPPKHGTSLATRIGAVDVLATPGGMLVRASDGVILAERLGSCGSNSPLLHEGKLYLVKSTATAVQLPESLPQPVQLKPLWNARLKGSGYWFSSPVIHDGLIYAPNDQGILTVLEAETGKIVYEQRLELEGTNYPSVSWAGNHIYISSDNGTTVVLQPGREYKELARNSLERFRSSVVFEGKRLYVRTFKNLYCIGK